MSINYNFGGRSLPPTKAQHAALLDQAMRLHQQGQLAQANNIYNTLLQANPRNVDALHMLGVLAFQTVHHQAACDLIGQAIELQPQDPAPYVNRGLALAALQRHEEALAHFDRAVALRPDFAEAHVNRGRTLLSLQRAEQAVESYDRALALQPRLVAAHNNKGNALRQLGRVREALRCYAAAVEIDERQVDAWLNMAALHADAGTHDDALQCFDKVLALQPGHAEANNGRGVILAQRKQWESAVPLFELAIQIDERHAAAHKNLGQAQFQLASYHQAVQALRRAVQLQPGDIDAQLFLGLALAGLGLDAEAMEVYGAALAQSPGRADLHYSLAVVLSKLQNHQEALAGYLRARSLDVQGKYVPGGVVDSRLKICDWTHLSDEVAKCEECLERGHAAVSPFTALAVWDDPALHLRVAQIFLADAYTQIESAEPFTATGGAGKIRVGYYSADFHAHATAFLMARLFEEHDRERFEWVAFSFGPSAQDPMRKRIALAFDHFIDVRERSDLDIARLSREMNIDIAVDLKGFTQGNRFAIFTHRCAPIQVSYLGYPGTTGASCIDYVIADKVVMPIESQAWFTEKAVYLPHSYQVNDPQRTISARVFTRAELGLPATGFVFCCFNNNYKILPKLFDSWMRILHAVPGSVLWLLEDNAAVASNLRREALTRGIAAERLVFASRMPLEDHLARHRHAGLFLDTLPYNAHTTASDALWAGLPVLTREGRSFAGRVAASLLHAVGLPELVTRSDEEYEALAITLAQAPQKLQRLREKLRAQGAQAPLFDARRFARDIEAAYLAMQERRLQGLPPDVIEVSERGENR